MTGAWNGAEGWTPETVQTEPALFSTTFTFPWVKAPLSMNDRMHHIVKAKKVAAATTRTSSPRSSRCALRVHEPDEADLAPAEVDGLVDAEVVPDDTREFMLKHMPEIRYEKGCTPHFEFTVSEVAA